MSAEYNPAGLIAEYSCISDFVAAAGMPMARLKVNQSKADYWEGQPSAGAPWFGLPAGTPCGTSAISKLVLAGWPEGAKRMADVAALLDSDLIRPADLKRRVVWGAQGDELSMDRVYSGRIDIAWRSSKRRVRQSNRLITLCADSIVSGDASSEALYWRGAAVVVLADMLQSAGYHCRIMGNFTGRTLGGETVSCTVIVKDFGATLSMVDCATLALPGFFRSIGHRWIPVHAMQESGSTGIAPRSLPKGIADYAATGVSSAELAAQWITRSIEHINSTESWQEGE